jgi:hypothetical protein
LDNGTDGCALAVYVNGVGSIKQVLTSTCTRTDPKRNTVWAIGTNPAETSAGSSFLQEGNIYSVRIYDRNLTLKEITKNADLDQIRYLAPREVKKGLGVRLSQENFNPFKNLKS